MGGVEKQINKSPWMRETSLGGPNKGYGLYYFKSISSRNNKTILVKVLFKFADVAFNYWLQLGNYCPHNLT